MTPTLVVADSARRQVVPADLWPARAARSMDAAHFNAVANDPTVRPSLGGEGPLDLTGLVTNPLHVAIATPHGGYVLANLGDGRYEVHSMFLPEGRGQEAYDAMEATASYMFAATDCVEGLTKVATRHRGAAALTLRAGFERRFTGTVPWGAEGDVPHDFFALTLERWCVHSRATEPLGEWFHAALEAVKDAAHSTQPTHADERAHNQFVGATILMLREGNTAKATQAYNRWARFAGYVPIRVLSVHPIIIDLDGIIVEVHQDTMEVLSCP